ncbi:MAG: SH3 beta-barrel fold-containing protein [Paludibacteraceae bacterium]|nr:SH3 beta-barrel fold-containing protein [Paludibacteraceae bacterium]
MNNKQSIFAMAWQLVKRYGFTFSEALSKSWAIAKLRTEMHTRIVKFYFEKVDGTIREAFGTLKSDLLPPHNPDAKPHKQNDSVVTYYDTEKESFRCFKIANFIRIAS